ncbi:hypothetical protein Y032_0050g1893 [Ancylostoma ceylanicum]|uniref:Uncharacterized protein n=1 Tax=Ancylostoma ceylanicum TaxID=53326 RepID=A0A016U8X9_9BILA|nr:hypothetical protein Y032_0050g1893 [Ancylostoma ceylanicum]
MPKFRILYSLFNLYIATGRLLSFLICGELSVLSFSSSYILWVFIYSSNLASSVVVSFFCASDVAEPLFCFEIGPPFSCQN